ncbi:MAG: DMT family transporter [Pseudomonadota bacterium]
MTKNSALLAFGFGFMAAFFWGTHSVIVRYLTADLHGLTVAVLRLYIASAALYVIMKLYRRPVSINFSDKTFWMVVIGVTSNYIFFHWGLEHTGASNAMMLENTAPFFVLAYLALVLRVAIRPIEVLASLLAIAGVYFTVRQDLAIGGEGLQGDLLEILAGATWAIFLLGSSRALSETQSTIERISFLFNVLFVSALLLTPLLLIYPPEIAKITANDAIFLLLLGIFPTAVASWLWYEAAARVSAVSATLLFTLSIIFTFVNAHLFLGEALTWSMLIGAALILAGVILSKVGAKKS